MQRLGGDAVADSVIGQVDFSHATANFVDSKGLSHPKDVAIDRSVEPNRLYICDFDNNRVLGYGRVNGLGPDRQPDVIIGQPDEFSNTPGTGPTSLFQPSAIAVGPTGGLFVADRENNRVLWFADPFGTDRQADKVFGQPDFNSRNPNNGGISARSLNRPEGVAFWQKGLFVADTANCRIVYYGDATGGGLRARQVYGQEGSFTTKGPVPDQRPDAVVPIWHRRGQRGVFVRGRSRTQPHSDLQIRRREPTITEPGSQRRKERMLNHLQHNSPVRVNLICGVLVGLCSLPVLGSDGFSGCTTATLTVQSQPATALYPRAVVINYDPIIESQSGQRLHQVYGWSDPAVLASGYASDLKSSSHNLANARVTQTVNADVFPVKSNGLRFTDSSFMQCWSSGNCDSGGVDYRAIVRDYDLARRVDSGEIDEVLVFGAPYFGYWESTMAGRGGYWCNSSPQVRIACSKIFIMMGFSYERGVGEMLEDYGHRTESIMTYVYGSWAAQKTHAWNRFTLYDKEMPGEAACGNVHYAPNSTSDYDWGNTNYVYSTCDYWLNTFPTGYPDQIGPKRSVNCSEWGNGDIRQHHNWWLSHIPHAAGAFTEYSMTRLNNWWAYMQGFNNQPESGGDFAKGGTAPPATPYPYSPRAITANTNDDWSGQINAAGRIVWQGFDGNDYEIFAANVDGTNRVQITSNTYNDEAPRINAAGRVVWQGFDGQDYEIYSANSDGTGLVQITSNTYNDWHPQISATGKVVWDASDGSDYEIYSANADGTNVARITNNNASSGYPRDDVWPQINGSNRLVWFGYDGSYWQIYSANADGSNLVNLSNASFDNEYPQINDSGRVVWQGWPTAGDNTNCEIYSANATGGTVTRITNNTYEDWYPQINNNGQVVWMSRPTGGKWEVRQAGATGGSVTTLSPTTHHSQYPRIDSTGRVVWQGFDGNDWEIYLWSSGTIYQVTNNTYDDRAPCMNDNEQIVWHAASGQGASGDSSEIFAVSHVQGVPGDFDHDGDVDQVDFSLLQKCLGVTNAAGDPACWPTDLSGDNLIDRADVVKFVGCMSGAGIPGDVNCAN